MSAAAPQGTQADARTSALAGRIEASREMLIAGRHAEGEAAAMAAYDEAVAQRQPALAAQAALLVAKVKANATQSPQAIEWSQRAVAAARASGERSVQAAAWVVLAGAAAESDRPQEALAAADTALSLVDDLAPSSVRRAVFTGLMITYNALGLSARALPAARRALAAELGDGDTLDRVRARWNLLVTGLKACRHFDLVDPPRSRATLDELMHEVPPMIAEARSAANAVLLAGALHDAGQVLARAGQVMDGLLLMEEASRLDVEEPADVLSTRWLDLAKVQREAGNPDAAQRSTAHALALASRIVPSTAAQDIDVQVLLAEAAGNHAAALELHRRFHARLVHHVIAAFEHRVAEMAARLETQTLRLENLDLRERNRDLAADALRWSEVARIDALTGVLTRGALEAAYASLQDHRMPFALLLVDVDRFKAINDRHSHIVGDEVLRRIGALLREELRDPDIVGRYGGEEFAVLVTRVDAQTAVAVAERLRRRVGSGRWSDVAAGIDVTLSGGLVIAGPEEDFASAVARADALLYRAKREGRNRLHADAGEGAPR